MSGRTLQDQAEAMAAGYSSTQEWAFHKLLSMYRDLEERVTRLEILSGVTPEVIEPDPED